MEKRHILIVEDDLDTREILRMRFESGGHRVSLAKDGMEALQLVQKEMPDCVIMDIMMPNMNGYKATRLLKFDPRWERIPVLMLSARTTKKDRDMGMESGAQEYVVKPFDVDGVYNLTMSLVKPVAGQPS